MKVGREKILNKAFLLVFFFILLKNISFSQQIMSIKFEEKAIDYFCNNIDSIIPNMDKSKIRFNGKTKGAPSSVFNIADCQGEINLLKDSMPNSYFLDSLYKVFSTFNYPKIKINKKCLKSNKFIFNNSIYTLNLFNSIEYKHNRYVELYLINKKLQSYIIIIKFDDHSDKVTNYFIKSRIY